MPAERGAALDDGSLAALSLGLKHSLFVLSGVLVLGKVWSGNSVCFNGDVADTLSVRDLSSAFGVAIAPQI